MDAEQYQGFTIESGDGQRPDVLNRWGVRWFSVSDPQGEVFTAVIEVSRRYGGAGDLSEIAEEHGRAWVHGLLNLGRFERGQNLTRTLSTEWDRLFGEQAVEGESLRWEVLAAARRTTAAEDRTGVIHGIDSTGIAIALGISSARVGAVINELVREEGLAPYMETFGHTAQDGACQITSIGLRALREGQHVAQPRARSDATRIEGSQIGVLNLGTIGQVGGSNGPVLHITDAVVADKGAPGSYVGMVLRLALLNVGQQPALNVRAHFEHDWLEVRPSSTVLRLVRPAEHEPLMLLGGVAVAQRPHPTDVPFPTQVRLVLQYRDPQGRGWKSSTDAQLMFAFEQERAWLQDSLQLSDTWHVAPLDQDADATAGPGDGQDQSFGPDDESIPSSRLSSEETSRRRSSSVGIEVLPPTHGTPTLYLYPDRVQLYARLNVRVLNHSGHVFVRRARVFWETVTVNGGAGQPLAELPLRSVDSKQTEELGIRITGPGQSEPVALHFEVTVERKSLELLPTSSRYVLHLDILGADDVEESIARFEVPSWPSSHGVMEVEPVWLAPPLVVDRQI
jgi:hypothetical protein